MSPTKVACSVCVYWAGYTYHDKGGAVYKQCKRYPPVIANEKTYELVKGKSPMTSEHDWCGEFKMKGN